MNVKTVSVVVSLIAAFGSTAAMAADQYIENQNMPAAAVKSAPRVAVRVAALDEYQNNQNHAVLAPSDLQRAQVVAEAIEARKLGLITEGERHTPAPTAAQTEQILLAGLMAVEQRYAAK